MQCVIDRDCFAVIMLDNTLIRERRHTQMITVRTVLCSIKCIGFIGDASLMGALK